MSASKPRNSGSQALVTIGVRVEPEVYDYYEKEAKKMKKTMTSYIRTLLSQGMMNAKIEEFEERTEQMLNHLEERIDEVLERKGFNNNTLQSIALTEIMLREIVSKLPEEKHQEMQRKAQELANKLSSP